MLFINVFKLNNKNVEIYLYADDTAIIFHTNNDKELPTIINNFFLNYAAWCEANCIVVNPNKSNFLMSNVSNIAISINDINLVILNYAKYLGVNIDDALNWKSYISFILT